MDDKEAKNLIKVLVLLILAITAFILPLIISGNIRQQREIELEKYKIEMQYKHGDVVEENK
jgi:hypothetical protein